MLLASQGVAVFLKSRVLCMALALATCTSTRVKGE